MILSYRLWNALQQTDEQQPLYQRAAAHPSPWLTLAVIIFGIAPRSSPSNPEHTLLLVIAFLGLSAILFGLREWLIRAIWKRLSWQLNAGESEMADLLAKGAG